MFDTLPTELLIKIFQYLNLEDQSISALVCCRFQSIRACLNIKPKISLLRVSNSFELLQWYWNHSLDTRTFNSATRNGNLENMKWLKANGCSWNISIFNYAAKNGNLENSLRLSMGHTCILPC